MSAETQKRLFASRVAGEFNALRGETRKVLLWDGAAYPPRGSAAVVEYDGPVDPRSLGLELRDYDAWFKRNDVSISSTVPQFALNPDPIFTRSMSPWLTSGNEVLYWPRLLHAEGLPGALNAWYLYYSTDHSNGLGGIGLATAPHPRGPWTDTGTRAYVDTVQGSQTETGHPVRDYERNRVNLYYQQKVTNADQSTLLAYSADGRTNWTRYGKVIDVDTPQRVPGDGHTGYANVYRNGKKWIANHLLGGANTAHFATSYSDDGMVWQMDRRAVPGRAELTLNNERRVSSFQTWPFYYHGEQFAVYVETPFVFGATLGDKEIKLARFSGPNKLTPMSNIIKAGGVAWGQTTVQQPHVIEFAGTLYLVFAADNATNKGVVGLMEARL